MRFVSFNDPHIRGNSPENRRDNFPETLKSKIQEIVSIAQGFNADYLLCGGDLNENPIPAMSIAGDIMRILLSAGIPIYAVPGNHDFFAANSITLSRSLLGFTEALGAINILGNEPIMLKKGGITVQLTGQAFHNLIDTEDRDPKLDYCVKKSPDCDYAIHIVHGMLTVDMDFPGDLTKVDDIDSTEADITIAGHNHIGWGILKREGKYFVNPGGISRLSNHKAEMSRTVSVALIEINENGISCELKALESALPGEVVLDRSKIEQHKELEKKLQMFTQELKASSDMSRPDVTAIIKQAAAEAKTEAYVLAEALRRIAIAEEDLLKRKGVA